MIRKTIGARAYEETAELEHLSLERNATTGRLIPNFDVLKSTAFDPTRAHPTIRDFYEHTPSFKLDTRAST